MNILVLDPQKTTQTAIRNLFSDHEIMVANGAAEALVIANETPPDLVIMELSLAGHSGLEFLYEFRTYTDWQTIPIIIYSMLRLEPTILSSRSWIELNISEYYYKPNTSLSDLKNAIEKHTAIKLA